MSRESLVLADVYDLTAMANAGKGRKPKPYPRPMSSAKVERSGKTSKTTAEVISLLAKMNPKET